MFIIYIDIDIDMCVCLAWCLAPVLIQTGMYTLAGGFKSYVQAKKWDDHPNPK